MQCSVLHGVKCGEEGLIALSTVAALGSDQRGGGRLEDSSNSIGISGNLCLDHEGVSEAALHRLLLVLLVALADPAIALQPDWYLEAVASNNCFGYNRHNWPAPLNWAQANSAFRHSISHQTLSNFVTLLVNYLLVHSAVWHDSVDFSAGIQQPSQTDLSAVLEGDAYYLWDAGHACHQPSVCSVHKQPVTSLGYSESDLEAVSVHSQLFGSPGSSFCKEVAYMSSVVDHAVYSNSSSTFRCMCFASAIEGLMPHGTLDVLPEPQCERTEHGWVIGNHPAFSAQQLDELKSTLAGLKHCFAYSLNDLPGYSGSLGPYRIPLLVDENTHIYSKPRPKSVLEKEVQNEKCCEMRDAGIIVRCSSTQYASDVVIAAKRDAVTKEWTDKRFCVNYRGINAAMKKDNYRLPLADEIFDTVKDCSIFSLIDMKSGFFQCVVAPEDRPKLCFHWNGELWMFTRMPFGIHSAPQTWQRIMDHELKSAGCWDFARAFIDDVLIFSRTPEEHIKHVQQVLSALHAVGLRAHPQKSKFACDVIEYLGFNVSQYGLTPNEAKVAAIAALKAPSNVAELRSVLGLLSYYRRFCKNFSSIAEPLNQLLKKGTTFVWGEEQQAAFGELKRVLCTDGLALKRVDSSKPLLLYTDWSKKGIGAVLAQADADGTEHICACVSRSLNKHEKNYCSFKGELLACVWACQTFRQYLHGVHFTIVTDHEPLKWLLGKKDLHGQYGRWCMIMSDYDMDIVHRPGVSHCNADAFSRMPRDSSVDVSGARMDEDEDSEVVAAACAVHTCCSSSSNLVTVSSPLVNLANLLSSSPMPLVLESGYSQVLDGSSSEQCISASCNACTVQLQNTLATEDQLLLQCACKAARECAVMQYACSLASCTEQPGNISSYDKCHLDLLAGSTSMLCDADVTGCLCSPEFSPLGEQRCSELRSAALSWHLAAAEKLSNTYVEPNMYQEWRPACVMKRGKQMQPHKDEHGVAPTAAISTKVLGQQFFENASAHGLVVLELFGGICSGLEMVLRNGIKVQRYFYCDKDPVVRRIAAHRLDYLNSIYPALLPPESYAHAFTAFPQDIQGVTSEHLLCAGAQNGDQWLVVAGWECQDLSPAGSGKGLSGNHSVTLFALRRVLGALQQLQQHKPPGYFLENTYLHHRFGSVADRSPAEFHFICQCIGHPVACDAAQFGSYAHRLRHYWANLACVEHINAVLGYVNRPAGLKVADILGPGRTALASLKSDVSPFYPCNHKGEPLSAWPTFTAYIMSRAFRPGQPGAVYDGGLQCWTEPTPDERECAMGFDIGCTAVPSRVNQPAVTEAHRHAALGRAMDMNAISGLFAICYVLGTASPGNNPSRQCSDSSVGSTSSTYSVPLCCDAMCAALDVQQYDDNPLKSAAGCTAVDPFYACSIYTMAAAEEEASCSSVVKRDIWMDPLLLQYVQNGCISENLPANSLRDLQRRARAYQWVVLEQDGKVYKTLYRKMPDGSTRVVPPPSERANIVKVTHEKCGHFGEKRTIQLLLTQYWWYGLYRAVYDHCKGCELCRRVNLSFNAQPNELQPLPIMGMMYRWGVDLAGEFLPTKSGMKYVMICIEHFSKHIELIALPDKKPVHTARAFLTHVLCRFGSCAEVVTDQGTEFRGPFDSLLESCYIDHRVTAPHRPQADGLAERCVQTIKKALRKYCEQAGSIDTWDEGMHWIALGYRCSQQASTRLSPYELLYARKPVVPPAIVQRLSSPINFDDPEAAAACLLQRAELVRQMCPEAMHNLAIAQHRDTLRYARIHSGEFKPSLVKFFPGQFVYVQQHNIHNTLQVKARPDILKVVEVRPGGQVTLQGKCGSTIKQNISNLAPCHLPYIDPTIDPTLARPSADLPCESCGSPFDEARMLLCSNCATGWHMQCLNPPLQQVPAGAWLCPYCVAAGVDFAQAQARETANELARQEAVGRVNVAPMFSKQRRRMLAEAESLHGRYIIYPFPGPSRTKVPTWGLVHYLGSKFYPRCMRVYYPTGQTFDVTLRSVRKYLQPVGMLPPQDVVINAPAVSPGEEFTSACVVSSPLQFTTPSLDLNALSSNSARLIAEHPGLSLADCNALSAVISLSHARQLLDPFYLDSSSNLQNSISNAQVRLLVNRVSAGNVHGHVAALEPGFWPGVTGDYPHVDVIVSCPWFRGEALDAALLQLSQHFGCVCFRVPWEYVTCLTPTRAEIFSRWQSQGRMHIIMSLPAVATVPRGVWLCVFDSKATKDSLLMAEYRAGACVSHVCHH